MMPNADLADRGNEYQVSAEVPGIPKDKLDVTVTKDGVEISCKTEVEKEEEKKGYILRERGYSQVHRYMAFPEEVVPENAVATMKDGVLELRVPKKMPAPKPEKHKVEIK
jgi:HSP20 family protein